MLMKMLNNDENGDSSANTLIAYWSYEYYFLSVFISVEAANTLLFILLRVESIIISITCINCERF